MKKFTLLIIALLAFVGFAKAEVDSQLTGKAVTGIGAAATSIDTGKWYLLKSVGRDAYISEETTVFRMRATGNFSAPCNAEEKAGYLFQFVATGTEGQYYIKSGNGLYFSLTQGDSEVSSEPVAYNIGLIGSATNTFYGQMVSGSRTLDANAAGGTLAGWGTTIPTSTTGNSAYQFLPLEMIDFDFDAYSTALEAASASTDILQKTNGVITDASQFFSNYMSEQEGSYAALLDGNASTYFHSAYGTEAGDGTGVHYLRVDLGEGKALQNFRFYTKKRNANNRPTTIEIYGSNDGTNYTKVETVNSGLDAADDYLSDAIDLGAEYRYIKFLVTATNTGTTFFTYSEFYVFDASDETTNSYLTNISNLKNASITDENMATYIDNVTTDSEAIAFAYYKQQASEAATAYEEYVAEKGDAPTVGQFTYETYTALQTAIENATTAEEIEAALSEFMASRNAPVYFIINEYTGGYSDGSAIYYNGTAWRWGAANKFSTQYMMKVPGATTSDIADIAVDAFDAAGTFYSIKDVATGTVIRGLPVQVVKIDDWKDAYNLQYNAGANNTNAAHHAQNGGALVNWKPATTSENMASAWSFEFVSDAYSIDQYADQLAAAAALQTAYNENITYKTAEFSTALGEYSYTGSVTIADAFTAAEAILNASYEEVFAMNVSDIEAATANIESIGENMTLNMPANGTYLRIRTAESHIAAQPYLSSVNSTSNTARAAFVSDADASTVFYYKDNTLLAVNTANYIANNNNFAAYIAANTATNITFQAAANGETGAYNVIFSGNNGATRYLYTNTGLFTDAGGGANGVGYNFNLEQLTAEEVAALSSFDLTVTDAGYASMYLDYAVAIPKGVTAYAVTSVETGCVKLTDYQNVIPANTGVIVNAKAGDYTFASPTTGWTAIDGTNLLSGTTADTYIEGDAYVLGKDSKGNVGLYKALLNKDSEGNDGETHFLNNANKAYLVVEGADGAQFYGFGIGEGTTVIEEVKTENGEVKTIYDLTGRRVETITEPGIYIVGGKKVLVK